MLENRKSRLHWFDVTKLTKQHPSDKIFWFCPPWANQQGIKIQRDTKKEIREDCDSYDTRYSVYNDFMNHAIRDQSTVLMNRRSFLHVPLISLFTYKTLKKMAYSWTSHWRNVALKSSNLSREFLSFLSLSLSKRQFLSLDQSKHTFR